MSLNGATSSSISFVGSVWVLEPHVNGPGGSPARVLGVWPLGLCGIVCLASFYFGARVVLFYRKLLDDDHPAANSPAVYLLSWLGSCDMLAATANLTLLIFDYAGDISSPSLATVRRVGLATQLCYLFIHMCLSLHVATVAGTIGRRAESLAGEYYGPVAGLVAFLLSGRLVADLAVFPVVSRLITPVVSLTSVIAATVCARSASRAGHAKAGDSKKDGKSPTDGAGDDSETEAVEEDLGIYATFAQRVASFHSFHLVTWMAANYSQASYPDTTLLAICCLLVCARGLLPFLLTTACPVATGPTDGTAKRDQHDHQE
ncbi:hypothetical protein GQ54DRAFT_312273 [Martensiomyces pterosporus]|nr:hypothetical protein GQ54DRAFT_312273 [Martensiomyces pterosporus]